MSKYSIPEKVIYVCVGSKCGKRGGKDLCKLLKHFDKNLEVIKTECTDRCKIAPVCSIQPGNIWLTEYSERQVLKVLEELGS
jgi:(2Fe-2S) ferredoxin